MTPTPAAGTQGSNLDNNSGAETSDEQALTNYARATGNYNGTLPVFDDFSLTRTAEDLAIHKSVDDATIVQGDISRWALNLQTSEYRYVDDLRVTDTLPDGLCPLGAANFETTPPAANAECNPVGGQIPSSTYSDVTENSNGSWTLEWDASTVPELAHMDPSADFDITFPTRARASYQENFADDGPVLTRDSWVNHVSVLGADFVICAPADPDCTGTGTPIDADEPDGIDDLDESSAGQEAGGVTIDKRVAQASPVSCAAGIYVDGPPPLYGPGDRVCWKVRVDFAGQLDSGLPQVTDFLPVGTAYEAGSAVPTAANNVTSTLDATQAGVLLWDLGTTVDSGGLVFEWRFSTIVTKDSSSTSGDVPGNLMKFAYANSAGTTFPLRDQVDFERDEAELSLLKGVRDVSNVPAAGLPANTDNREVQGGDTVTYRVDITNDGGRDAEDIEVWDDLPAGIDCSVLTVLNISDGGTCNTLTDRIEWSGLTLAAGASDTLTYDLVIPAAISPGQTLTNTAGVRSYTSDTNIGGSFLYIPESNIDPDVATSLGTPNAAVADDVSNVFTDLVTLVKARTTEVTGTGNGVADAAIGEEITYTLTATIPQGTTIYDSPTLTDVLSPRLTYIVGSAAATLNGTSLPTSGLTLTASGAPTTISVAFPSSYTNVAGSGDDVLVVTFKAKLADVATNFRLAGGTPVPNTGHAGLGRPGWNRANGGEQREYQRLRARAQPRQERERRRRRGRSGPDHPLHRHGVQRLGNADLNRARPDRGRHPAARRHPGERHNAGGQRRNGRARRRDLELRRAHDHLERREPRARCQRRARLRRAGRQPRDRGHDLPQLRHPHRNEPARRHRRRRRRARPIQHPHHRLHRRGLGPRAPRHRVDHEDGLRAHGHDRRGAGLHRRRRDPGRRRVLRHDRDRHAARRLRLRLHHEHHLPRAVRPGITGTQLPAEPQAGGETRLGWFLGDLAPAAANRTVRIVYRAHVDDTYAAPATPVVAGNTLVNGVAIYANRTNDLGTPSTIPPAASFDESTPAVFAPTTVVEPALSLDKTVSGAGPSDFRLTQPGDSYTYTVAITNNGNSPAYDVEVSDQPDFELTNVTLTDGAGLVTPDGWLAGDPDIHWLIPGPIAPGATVTLRYTADLIASAGLTQNQLVVNTADVDRYWGVAKAERDTNLHDYREYTNVAADTVTLQVTLPQLDVTKTTGVSGNPDTANAEVGQAFPWRVVIQNTSAGASALDVDVSDVLPRTGPTSPAVPRLRPAVLWNRRLPPRPPATRSRGRTSATWRPAPRWSSPSPPGPRSRRPPPRARARPTRT